VFGHIRGYLDHLAANGRSAQEIRTALYQYGPAAGQIRELIADSLLRDEGIAADAGSIVVTVGAQEAMLLVLRALFADPDDVLLVSTPCYVGIIGAAKLLGISIVAVRERDSGWPPRTWKRRSSPRRRAGAGRARSTWCRTIPIRRATPCPPMRAVHCSTSRRAATSCCSRTVLPPGQRRTAAALAQAPRPRPAVVHIGSYAKSAFPGARLGYVVADQVVTGADGRAGLLADELAKIKSMVTVNTRR